MPVVANELVWRRAQAVTNDSSNGGRMSHVALVPGVKNNIFPDVSEAERVSGSTTYRKLFLHIANDDDLGVVNGKLFLHRPTTGDDAVVFFPGTQTDTQAALSGSERAYGGGKLNANVSAGGTSVAVLTEGASLDYFKAGDLIRLSDKTTVDAVSGVTEYATIAAGGVSYSGDVATLTLTTGLNNGFSASSTFVSSVLQVSSIAGAVQNFIVTSGGGNYDNGGYPVITDHIGGIYQDWTLNFTSATQLTVTGDTVGLLGTFPIGSNINPVNSNHNKPYFLMNTAGFSGAFSAGNSITFRTVPAAYPHWAKRVVPPGATSLSGNTFTFGFDAESG